MIVEISAQSIYQTLVRNLSLGPRRGRGPATRVPTPVKLTAGRSPSFGARCMWEATLLITSSLHVRLEFFVQRVDFFRISQDAVNVVNRFPEYAALHPSMPTAIANVATEIGVAFCSG
jgi:hypothetical protein